MPRQKPALDVGGKDFSWLAYFQNFFLVVAFFVAPLLFFTNLTRNPYITQICLLNIAIAFALTAWAFQKASTIKTLSTSLNGPLGMWTLIGFLSLGWAFFRHAPFFRPSVFNEGAGHEIFWLLNCLGAFALGVISSRELEGVAEPPNIVPWTFFCVAWGSLWFLFPQMRSFSAAPSDTSGLTWDSYGACLWGSGIACVFWLCRKGRWMDYLHLALAVGFLASAYGILQYFNLEFIWPYALNPYGGRAVSTFGNPNFLSSYDVILIPFCVALWARSKGIRRYCYGFFVLIFEAGLLCTLTRSSWLGAVAAVAVLFASQEFRKMLKRELRLFGLFFGVAFALALLWPHSLLSVGYRPSVLGRLTEVKTLLSPVIPGKQKQAYAPWHQRVLIWTCAWMMEKDSPLTGQGFGLFELVYPFYQGPVLNTYPFYRGMRTHANNAHNEIMEVLSQTGLIGLGLFLWIWAVFFRAARDSLGDDEAGGNLWVSCAIAGVVGMLVDNLLNVSLHFAVPAFLFWWVVGLAMGQGSGVKSNHSRFSSRKNTLWIKAAALIVCSMATWHWVCVWNRETHYFAGFKLVRQGDLSGAIQELESSRAWGPPEVNAIYELGNAYARTGFFKKADQSYAQALKANAGYDEIYFNIGSIRANHLGEISSAIDYFRVSWLINPLLLDIYDSLGALYLRDPSRYLSPALELMASAVRFFPQSASFWNNLGYLETLKGDYIDAENSYRQALKINPSLVAAQKNLSVLLRSLR
jgi:O-antigen ligase/Tfp pilus assembly protein PilF